jgi:uncharacterized membrane protein YraQ (UPF0718 family)
VTRYIIEAFVSGVIVEALYALGVLFIGERRGWVSGAMSVVWGAAFLVGVNDSFKTPVAAAVWCLGLGVGTVLAVKLKPPSDPTRAE